MSLSYKSSSIIGGPLDAGVLKQLEVRKKVISKRTSRTDKELLYLNSTTGWVKLSSAVDVFTGDDVEGKPQYTNALARNNVLLGGTAPFGNRLGGIFNDYDNAYSKSDVTGYRPMAGITSFTVSSKNTFGTLRVATIDIKVNSVEQLDEIEQLYFRPGMSVLLEWGHSLYYDNDGKFDSTVETFPNFFTGKSGKVISEKIVELKTKSNDYNYDAIYGFVKNFVWSYNLDGGYDCKIDVVSKGELIESLEIVLYPGSSTDNVPTDSSENKSQHTTALHSYLNTIKNHTSNTGVYEAVKSAWPDIFSTVYANLDNIGRSQQFVTVNFSGTAKDQFGAYTRYIQMSTFLELLNTIFCLRDQNNDALIEFNYGQSGKDTPYFTFPQHFSLDPAIAILPKPNGTTTLRYKIQDQATFISKGEDEILNIYLNIDYILRCYDTVVQGQDLTDKTLINFVKAVLKGLQESLGEINDFDIHHDEEESRLYVVDRRVLPSNDDLAQSKIDLIGLNSQLENLSFASKLSGNITTMMAISAQAAETNAGTDMLMMQKWNDGLIDRHLLTKGVGKDLPKSTSSFKDAPEIKSGELTRLTNFVKTVNSLSSLSKISYNVEDIEGLKPAHKYIMNKLSDQVTKTSKQNPGGLIPFELSFTMKGISGMKIGQAFRIADESILPTKYRGNCAFIITKLDHSIQSNRWVTNVGTQMILSSKFTAEVTPFDEEYLESKLQEFIAEEPYTPAEAFDRVDVNTLRISQNGVNLIKKFEGFKTSAYKDPGSGNLPITIGYGTTRINGRPIELGKVITKPQAETYLKIDVLQFEASVKNLVKVPVSQHEFDALVSFVYNAGAGNLKGSTLLKKLNQKDYDGASNEFTKWTKAGGEVLPGLVNRRNAEKSVFRVNLQITGV